MSMEEIRRNYENLMEALSLLRAIGLYIDVDVTRIYAEGGRIFMDAVVEWTFKEPLERTVRMFFRFLKERREEYRKELEKMARSIEKFRRERKPPEWDEADVIVFNVLTNSLLTGIVMGTGVDPMSLTKEDIEIAAKVAGTILMPLYKEAFRDVYGEWREMAEEVMSMLEEMGLLKPPKS